MTEAEVLFFASLFLWVFACVLDSSLLSAHLRMRVTAMLCLCGALASLVIGDRSPSWSYFGIVCIAAVLPCLVLQGLSIKLWCTVAFVALSRGMSFRKLLACCLAALSLALLAVLVCMLFGVVPNVVERGERVRQYLGFRYSLYPSQVVFMITCAVVYLKGDQIKWGHEFLLIALNVLFFVWTDSRLSFALAIVVIAWAIAFRGRKPRAASRGKVSDAVLCWAFPIAAAVSIFLVAIYDPSLDWMWALDSVLGGRLRLGSGALASYGILPFGQFIDFVGNGLDSAGHRVQGTYNYVDFLFVNALLRFGMIGMLAFTALMTRASFSSWKAGDRCLLFILAVIAAHCIIDDLCLYLHFDPFLFAISANLVTTSAKESETLSASLSSGISHGRASLLLNNIGWR